MLGVFDGVFDGAVVGEVVGTEVGECVPRQVPKLKTKLIENAALKSGESSDCIRFDFRKPDRKLPEHFRNNI